MPGGRYSFWRSLKRDQQSEWEERSEWWSHGNRCERWGIGQYESSGLLVHIPGAVAVCQRRGVQIVERRYRPLSTVDAPTVIAVTGNAGIAGPGGVVACAAGRRLKRGEVAHLHTEVLGHLPALGRWALVGCERGLRGCAQFALFELVAGVAIG